MIASPLSRLMSSPTRQLSTVACNIYVSAGRQDTALLDRLLVEAQKTSTVVHAFADVVYNRSSFHLAGSAQDVAESAKLLSTTAINELRKCQEHHNDNDVKHPYVGLVDHIAVMSLDNDPAATIICARTIGDALNKNNVHVYYYGAAHPDKLPLARVRKEYTNFFKSGGLSSDNDSDKNSNKPVEVATVGVPSSFVENYNIRLRPNVDKRTAMSLTRHLRERDGGLPGVEALTLPYSDNRFEIACNLLELDKATTNDIIKQIQVWDNGKDLIETHYRVGTTREECVRVLSMTSDELERHKELVRKRFAEYLN